MDFVAVARIDLRNHLVARLLQEIRDGLDALTIIPDRILVSCHVENGELRRDSFCPLLPLDGLEHFDEVEDTLLQDREGKRIEWILCMIRLDMGVMANPLIPNFYFPDTGIEPMLCP